GVGGRQRDGAAGGGVGGEAVEQPLDIGSGGGFLDVVVLGDAARLGGVPAQGGVADGFCERADGPLGGRVGGDPDGGGAAGGGRRRARSPPGRPERRPPLRRPRGWP